MKTSVALGNLMARFMWTLRSRWSRITWPDLMTLAILGLWAGTALLVNRPLRTELKALEARTTLIRAPSPEKTTRADDRSGSDNTPADSVAAFLAFLPAADAREQQLQSLHGMARESGVELTRVDYTHIRVEHLPGKRLSMQLSLAGGYATYRTFLRRLLIALPNLAVDRIAMEASPGAPGRMTVKLEASLYYRGEAGPHKP